MGLSFLENKFKSKGRTFIVRQIEHDIEQLALARDTLTLWKHLGKAHQHAKHIIVYTITANAKDFNKYKLLGTLKELHDLKDLLIPPMQIKNLDCDHNWVVIESFEG